MKGPERYRVSGWWGWQGSAVKAIVDKRDDRAVQAGRPLSTAPVTLNRISITTVWDERFDEFVNALPTRLKPWADALVLRVLQYVGHHGARDGTLVCTRKRFGIVLNSHTFHSLGARASGSVFDALLSSQILVRTQPTPPNGRDGGRDDGHDTGEPTARHDVEVKRSEDSPPSPPRSKVATPDPSPTPDSARGVAPLELPNDQDQDQDEPPAPPPSSGPALSKGELLFQALAAILPEAVGLKAGLWRAKAHEASRQGITTEDLELVNLPSRVSKHANPWEALDLIREAKKQKRIRTAQHAQDQERRLQELEYEAKVMASKPQETIDAWLQRMPPQRRSKATELLKTLQG